MNLPNKLTFFRILLIPVFMLFAAHNFLAEPLNRYLALGVFALASLTDWLDGYIARRCGQVTNLGKLLDPIADKLLVSAALVCLLARGVVSVWAVAFVLAREFLITGVRVAAASSDGSVIAASFWGKLKTFLQLVAVLAALFFMERNLWTEILIWLSTAVCALSGADYIVKNRKYLKN
jgi:CDP-diacylglycerol--glycerol-3-phosphate 3-phosphatidyltransferase